MPKRTSGEVAFDLEKGEFMNSPKLTNILLIALVLLLSIHIGIEIFRPIGRYVRTADPFSHGTAVLDTSSGTVYGLQYSEGVPETGAVVNIVHRAENERNWKSAQALQASPQSPTEEPPDERH